MAQCRFQISGKLVVCLNEGCTNRMPYTPRFPSMSQYSAMCKSLSGKAKVGSERPAPCPQLGEATGEVALVKCHTCKGNVHKKFDVQACAVFAECLPNLSGIVTAEDGKTYHGCAGCRSNPAKDDLAGNDAGG